MKYITAAAVFLALVIVGVVYIRHNYTHKSAADDCLRDPDCRSRLEAAVNDIYSQIGYTASTSEN